MMTKGRAKSVPTVVSVFTAYYFVFIFIALPEKMSEEQQVHFKGVWFLHQGRVFTPLQPGISSRSRRRCGWDVCRRSV